MLLDEHSAQQGNHNFVLYSGFEGGCPFGRLRIARCYRRSSAFIGGQYLVLIFGLGEEKHIWPPMNADERR